MDTHTLQETAKGWLHPPHPGKGKNPVIGFVLGFFLGVFGVGIYLRSLTEFACCLIAVMLLMPFLFGVSSLLLPVFCGLWVVGRILWDNRQTHEPTDPAVEATGTVAATPACPDGAPLPESVV